MDATVWSLTGFAVAMYITPGPNNTMLASSGANHGLRATVPHMLGIAAGFALMLVLVDAGLGSALLAIPGLLPVMRWGGAAWMLYLAWKIATAPPPGTVGHVRILGLFGAMAFQWINPKGWLIALAVASEFTRADRPLPEQLLRIGVVFGAVSIPCMLPWILLGTGVRSLLRSPIRLRIFNLAMAALLIASLVPVLTSD
ncbi:MAG: LysE family translocator [Rhodospirillales bacterium]